MSDSTVLEDARLLVFSVLKQLRNFLYYIKKSAKQESPLSNIIPALISDEISQHEETELKFPRNH